MGYLDELWKKSTSDITDHQEVVNEDMQDTVDVKEDDNPMKQDEAVSPGVDDEEVVSSEVNDEEVVSSEVNEEEAVSSEVNDEEPDFPKNNDVEFASPENYDEEVETVEEEIQVDFTEQLTSIQESIAALQEVVENLQYNVSMLVQNQASASDVAAMRRENEAFRSDSNMKLMRKYGIDAMIKTYQAVCDKIFRINHSRATTSTAEGEKVAYEWLLRRMERQFKPLGIRLKRTEPGSEIDDSVMVVYGSEGEDVDESETIISTDIEELKDTVKESVSPAFLWTIPSLIGDGKEWCMEPEKVCIYK